MDLANFIGSLLVGLGLLGGCLGAATRGQSLFVAGMCMAAGGVLLLILMRVS